MKLKILKVIASLGVASVFMMAGTASAHYYHGPHQHHHAYNGSYHDYYGHTYHTPEFPFIW